MSGLRWSGLDGQAAAGVGAAPILHRHGPGCDCFQPAAPVPASKARTQLWQLPESLHCSVIGTCLTTEELRRALGRLNFAPAGASDHDLHARAVGLAGRPTPAAKALGKALDDRHRIDIGRFDRAETQDEVRSLWKEAMRNGVIPGAYWALLTHPASNPVLIHEAFGEVHMLSHLLGAANRADLRRLRTLEAENTELRDTVERQQLQHQATLARHTAAIRDLQRDTPARQASRPPPPDETVAMIAALERRLAAEIGRREKAETLAEATTKALVAERHARRVAEERVEALSGELGAMEARLNAGPDPAADRLRLDGRALLYVGGRTTQVAHLRGMAKQAGADFLHHDGGLEDSTDLLPGLVARADLVLFPVDCVSHDAALRIKRLCRQSDKRFVALRSTGAAAFLSGISQSL